MTGNTSVVKQTAGRAPRPGVSCRQEEAEMRNAIPTKRIDRYSSFSDIDMVAVYAVCS
jgi:hypothetical protein